MYYVYFKVSWAIFYGGYYGKKFLCEKDKEEFRKVLSYNLQLVCGKWCKDNDAEIQEMLSELNKSIKSLETVNYGANEYLDSRREVGETMSNSIGQSKIYMKGYNNAPTYIYNSIQHTFSHELFHAIYALMNRCNDRIDLEGKRIFWIGKANGKSYIGVGGTLCDRNAPNKYGKLFEETMMDMKASMALAEFDKEYQLKNQKVTADTILSDNISKWGNYYDSSYKKMVSLTQLMIAAFANEPDINYHYWIHSGQPMDKLKSRRKNGEIIYANDFLYGMMYDPIHIMEKYDKYMDEGAYINLLKFIDEKIYYGCIDSDKIDAKSMKKAMATIAEFANKRMTDFIKNGVFSIDEYGKLRNKFNTIWNSILEEYDICHTVDEL